MASQQSRVTGIAEVDRHLRELSARAAKRIVRSSTQAGLDVVEMALFREIAAAPNLSDPMKQSLQLLLGKRFVKVRKRDEMQAKAGFAVGKARKVIPFRSAKAGGVGISGQNVHWVAAGTKDRYVKRYRLPGGGGQLRRYRRPRYVGRMTPPRIVLKAIRKSGDASLAAMRESAFAAIDREIARLRKGS